MACSKLSLGVLLALLVVLTAGLAMRRVEAASAHLHFYMHDVTGGPGVGGEPRVPRQHECHS